MFPPQNPKKNLKDLLRQVNAIRNSKLNKRKFKIEKLLVAELKVLYRWKKQQGDKPLPTRKADLIVRFRATRARTSPTVSPSNSDDEESDEDGNNVDSYDSDATPPTDDELEFGHDSDGEDESSDEEDEESDEGGSSGEEKESDEDDSS